MLTVKNIDIPLNDCIILNSGNLYGEAALLIKETKYKKIRLWFDNDSAGLNFEKSLVNELKNLAINTSYKTMNPIYKEFKDLNEWFVAIENKKADLM